MVGLAFLHFRSTGQISIGQVDIGQFGSGQADTGFNRRFDDCFDIGGFNGKQCRLIVTMFDFDYHFTTPATGLATFQAAITSLLERADMKMNEPQRSQRTLY